MKKVFVASSRKFYGEVKKLKKKLDAKEIIGFYPYFEFDDEEVERDDKLKQKLTLKHFPEIDRADVLYIFAKNGYAGISVAIETAYAFAKSKEIISSEPLAEFALRALVSKIMNPDEFVKYLLK